MSANEEPIGRFEYEQTDELITRAALAFCQFHNLRLKKPRLWTGRFILSMLLVVGLSLLLLAYSFLLKGEDATFGDWILKQWIVLTPLAVFAFFMLLLLFLTAALRILPRFTRWFVPWMALRRARKLWHRRVQVTLYEDRLEGKTAARETRLPWSELRNVYVVPDFWLLTLKSQRRILYFPTQALTPELQALIRRKITEAGVKFEEWALPPLQVWRS